MSLRKVSFVEGEYFHLYNRGNSKQTIFHDQDDYYRFIKTLFLSNGQVNFKISNIGKSDIFNFDRGNPIVNIGAYCLMPNHFHLLLSQPPNGSISKFMQKLSTGYSMYHNTRHGRTGALFEGKFKSEHVDTDRYLKYTFAYIHLNPVKLIDPKWKEEGIRDKTKTIKFLEQYKFSSYQDYLGHNRREARVINLKAFPNYFTSPNLVKKDIFEWLDFK